MALPEHCVSAGAATVAHKGRCAHKHMPEAPVTSVLAGLAMFGCWEVSLEHVVAHEVHACAEKWQIAVQQADLCGVCSCWHTTGLCCLRWSEGGSVVF